MQDNDKDTTHWRRPPHAKKAEKIFNSLKFLRHLSAVHPPAPPKTITLEAAQVTPAAAPDAGRADARTREVPDSAHAGRVDALTREVQTLEADLKDAERDRAWGGATPASVLKLRRSALTEANT